MQISEIKWFLSFESGPPVLNTTTKHPFFEKRVDPYALEILLKLKLQLFVVRTATFMTKCAWGNACNIADNMVLPCNYMIISVESMTDPYEHGNKRHCYAYTSGYLHNV